MKMIFFDNHIFFFAAGVCSKQDFSEENTR